MSGIVWNDDWQVYFRVFEEEYMDEAHLRAYVREFEGTQIKELFFNPNVQATNYRGFVRRFTADGYDPANPDPSLSPAHQKRLNNLYLLDQKGLNPNSIWLDECRKCGISPWISIRMNDVHFTFDKFHPNNSNFWCSHPEYRRAEYRFQEHHCRRGSGLYYLQLDRALDYAHPEVRMHQMALIAEFMEMYDMDGLEMDFLRFSTCFRPGFEEQGIEIMNSFIREVRACINKWEKQRGHTIHLGVRVHIDPQTSLSFGLDVHEWTYRGWVDWVTPMKRDRGHGCGAPYKLWKKLLEGTGALLCGGMTLSGLTGNYSNSYMCAVANSLLSQGVERIYVFNGLPAFMNLERDITEDFRTLIKELDKVGELSKTVNKHRRYIFEDLRSDSDFAPGEIPAILLPMHIPQKARREIRIHLGCISNESVRLLLGVTDCVGDPGFAVRVNGTVCKYTSSYKQSLPNPNHPLCSYAVPTGAAHDGYNIVEIFSQDSNRQLDWMEVEVSGDQKNG